MDACDQRFSPAPQYGTNSGASLLAALVGASRTDRADGKPLSADEADGIAYLLLCAAVGNAHLSQTGISPARAGRLSTFCRKALALLTS